MYQSIYDYAKKRQLVRVKYRCQRKVRAYILLDEDGEYEGVEIISKNEPRIITAPDTGKFYTAGMASPVCDKKGTIFGNKKHDSWVQLMKQGEEACEHFIAVNRFLSSDDATKALEEIKDLKDDEFISFRVDDVNLEENIDWMDWFDTFMDEKMQSKSDVVMGVSALTGKTVELISGNQKFPMCRGGIFGTGIPIYANSHKKEGSKACSFKSYGLETEACPMSAEEAETIQTGMEALFSSDRTCARDLNLIYWLERDDEDFDMITDELLHQFNKEDAEKQKQLKAVLNAVMTGDMITSKADKYKNVKFHLMEYSMPDKGRFALYEDRSETYSELLTNIRKWYADTSINLGPEGSRCITNINSVLFSLLDRKDVKEKQKEINGEFGRYRTKLVEAAMFNGQIPKKFYRAACRQVTRSMIHDYDGALTDLNSKKSKETSDVLRKYSPRTALRIIKVYLIREGYEMTETINPANSNIGYLGGRLLAIMEKIQKDANKGKAPNLSLAQKYFKMGAKNPQRMFNKIESNTCNYLKKIERLKEINGKKIDGHGLAVKYSNWLNEVKCLQKDNVFPKKFTDEELGMFFLGYRQQIAELYRKKDPVDKVKPENETNNTNIEQ